MSRKYFLFFLKYALFVVIIFSLLYFLLVVLIKPSNEREWSEDQKFLPEVIFEGDKIIIKNFRDNIYKSTNNYKAQYKTETFDLKKLESAWLAVEPFGKFGAAHTLLSFGFSDGKFLAISAEIRKEKYEEFSAFKGLFRQYELMYVLATEEDVLMLRTNYRKDIVRLYPIKADKEKIKAVLVSMLEYANHLKEHPQFYNTVTNNCATNIVKHVRKFSSKDIPVWDIRYLMPEYFDEIAYNLGVIDTKLPLDKAREKFNITPKAQNCSREDFSFCVRDGLR